MKNYKSILCLLLSLVLIVSVAFPLGASAVEEPGAGEGGNRGIKLTFFCGDEQIGEQKMIYVDSQKTELTAEDLAAYIPEGYELIQSLVLKPGATELFVPIEKIQTAPEHKNVPIKFMTDGTTVVSTQYVTVAEGEEVTLSAAALAVLAPEGYELVDKDMSVKVTFNTAEVRVLVSEIEVPAPEHKNVPIKFMTDGTTVVSTQYVTVAEGEEVTLSAAALAVLAPEGYELVDKDMSVKVTFNTAEVRVLVSEIEVPAPEHKNVPIKFMTDGTTVVETRYVTVAEGEEVTLSAAALAVLAPEGYELVDKERSVKVTFNTAEVRVLVSEIEVPAPEHKNVPIKFMTDGTTVVSTQYVTVAEGEEVTLSAAALAVLAPEGYELVDKDMSVKVTFNTAEVRVLVSEIEVPAPEHKNVPIKFMTDGTTVVSTQYVTVAEGEEVTLSAAALAVLAPEGYELVDKDMSVKVTFNTAEVRVLVSEIEVPAPEHKNVPIKFMTDGTTVVETRYVTVAEGEEVTLSAAALAVLAPEGYELVDKERSVKVTFNTAEVRVLVSEIEVPAPEHKNVPIKFMTDGTTVVSTQYVTVAEGEEVTLSAAALAVLAPEGYELVDKDMSVKVTFNTAEVRVLVSKVEVPTEPTVPETTEPTLPETTEPTVPETTEPTVPETTEPSVPETTEPSTPATTAPSVPATTEAKTPNTGDASDTVTWVFLLTISAVCAACVFFYNKKTR